MENKFLCHLKWQKLTQPDRDGDCWPTNYQAVKEMTVEEMNTFINDALNATIIVLKEIIPTKTPNPSYLNSNEEIVDLNTITPDFNNENFDINTVLEDCYNVISNKDNKSPIENFQDTKLRLWVLTHYVQQNLKSKQKGLSLNIFISHFKWFINNLQLINKEEIPKRLNEYLIDLEEIANGGTPEVDNTVGQTFTKEEITYLARYVHEQMRIKMNDLKNHNFETELYKKLCKCKPVETTKEQPKERDRIIKILHPWIKGDVAYFIADKITKNRLMV